MEYNSKYTQTAVFNATEGERQLITRIVDRASRIAIAHKIPLDRNEKPHLALDIEACHSNGRPLELELLLASDDVNFTHDVFGIRRHINRNTGKLEDCFIPRYSKNN